MGKLLPALPGPPRSGEMIEWFRPIPPSRSTTIVTAKVLKIKILSKIGEDL